MNAFAAREVIVSALDVVYGVGEVVDEESVGLRQCIKQEAHADGTPTYVPLFRFAPMLSFAIACGSGLFGGLVSRATRAG